MEAECGNWDVLGAFFSPEANLALSRTINPKSLADILRCAATASTPRPDDHTREWHTDELVAPSFRGNTLPGHPSVPI